MTPARHDAPHWLLLRGLTRESRHWSDFPGRLAAALPGQRVDTIDLPGNGDHAAQTSPASVARMTDFVRQHAALHEARAGAPLRLLGMSLGAMVAVDWATRFPGEIDRLVLVNTSLRPFSTPWKRLRPHNWPALARLAARWARTGAAAGTEASIEVLDAAIEHVIHRMTCRPGQPAGEVARDIARWTHIRRSAPVSAASAARQLWAAARFGGGADAPVCPALVLSSAGDRLVHPDCSGRLARAWQAAHRVHPDAGHDLPHDAPDWVCAEVAAWLAVKDRRTGCIEST